MTAVRSQLPDATAIAKPRAIAPMRERRRLGICTGDARALRLVDQPDTLQVPPGAFMG
jgi:hypothetical protein